MFVKRVWQRFQVSPGAIGKAVWEAGKVLLSAKKEPVVRSRKQKVAGWVKPSATWQGLYSFSLLDAEFLKLKTPQ